MPLYEYKCTCGNQFELLRSIADRHSTTCKCSKVATLQISSWGRVIVAGWDRVVNSDGVVVAARQSTDYTSPLPERVHGSRI